jgi:hypothetical protein
MRFLVVSGHNPEPSDTMLGAIPRLRALSKPYDAGALLQSVREMLDA